MTSSATSSRDDEHRHGGRAENLQHDQATRTCRTTTASTTTQQTRNYAQFDATYFGRAAGQHQVKGGFQIDRRANDVINGELQNLVT